jgi:uncharacterized protein
MKSDAEAVVARPERNNPKPAAHKPKQQAPTQNLMANAFAKALKNN